MRTMLSQMAREFPGQDLTVLGYTPRNPPAKDRHCPAQRAHSPRDLKAGALSARFGRKLPSNPH
jgi:hypothetical protein